MTKSILRCVDCKRYSLESSKCSVCGGRLISPHPARFSLEKERKYSKYRRKLIKDQQK